MTEYITDTTEILSDDFAEEKSYEKNSKAETYDK